MSISSKYSLQDLETTFLSDFSQQISTCMLCADYSGSNNSFFDQQNHLLHVQTQHKLEKRMNNGVVEYFQNGFLVGSHSDKCILKSCATRILENKKIKLGDIPQPEDLCLRLRLPASTNVSLFETLEEEDILKGIFLCQPHLLGKQNVLEIFKKYGVAGCYTPNFTIPKPIKSGNIPMSSSNFKKRLVVQKVVCTSLPYDALQMDYFVLSKEKEEIESELNNVKLILDQQLVKPQVEQNSSVLSNLPSDFDSIQADLFVKSNLVSDLEKN